MKGSGKTRILNLITNLAKNGKHLISLSEAVLFRTASNSTFCIDEFERIAGKEKQALRELLNAGYKKGMAVERAKKVTFQGGQFSNEKYKIERYELYCPIAMANIWGMEEVLADRCISLVLEKSSNKKITRILENFDENKEISGKQFEKILNSILQKYQGINASLSLLPYLLDEYQWNILSREQLFSKIRFLFNFIGADFNLHSNKVRKKEVIEEILSFLKSYLVSLVVKDLEKKRD